MIKFIIVFAAVALLSFADLFPALVDEDGILGDKDSILGDEHNIDKDNINVAIVDTAIINLVINNLVINEIMPAPKNGEPEWIELFNNSADNILISGFTINDLIKTVPLPEFEIPAAGYAVLTKDTALLKSIRDIPESAAIVAIPLPIMNNTTDAVVLKTAGGQIIDSLYYDMKWGTKGISLERIDPNKPADNKDNLQQTLAIDGGTPGAENSYSRTILPLLPEALKINEIMFDVTAGHSAFIELWNSTDTLINLYGIEIYDEVRAINQKPVIIDSKTITIQPGSYAVIAEDSAIFDNFPFLNELPVYVSHKPLSLNHSRDAIIVKDAAGQTLDSMVYEENWQNEAINTENQSLEKLNPQLLSDVNDSWSSSADPMGATPGRINSMTHNPSQFNIVIKPNPFSTQGRNGSQCSIKYKLPFRMATITATIHDLNGIELRQILNDGYSAAAGEFIWDGKDNNTNILPPGPYILNMEAVDNQTGKLISGRKMIVIGE